MCFVNKATLFTIIRLIRIEVLLKCLELIQMAIYMNAPGTHTHTNHIQETSHKITFGQSMAGLKMCRMLHFLLSEAYKTAYPNKYINYFKIYGDNFHTPWKQIIFSTVSIQISLHHEQHFPIEFY